MGSCFAARAVWRKLEGQIDNAPEQKDETSEQMEEEKLSGSKFKGMLGGVTVVAFLSWASYTGFPVAWYHVVGSLMLGLLVAYAAMFGFDKLKQAFYDLGAARPVKFGDADCILCDAAKVFEVCEKLFSIEENCVIAREFIPEDWWK